MKYEVDMLKNLLIRRDFVKIHVTELLRSVNSGMRPAGFIKGL